MALSVDGSLSQGQHQNKSGTKQGNAATVRLLGLGDVEEPLFQGVYVDCVVVL